jgi:hypothetical protein
MNDAVRKLAYQLWHDAAQPKQNAVHYWLEAEHQLAAPTPAPEPVPTPVVPEPPTPVVAPTAPDQPRPNSAS